MIKETCHISRWIVITINFSFHFDEVFNFCFASRFRKYKSCNWSKVFSKMLIFFNSGEMYLKRVALYSNNTCKSTICMDKQWTAICTNLEYPLSLAFVHISFRTWPWKKLSSFYWNNSLDWTKHSRMNQVNLIHSWILCPMIFLWIINLLINGLNSFQPSLGFHI